MAVDVTTPAPTPKFTFTERAKANNYNDSQILNSNNADGPQPPADSDVVIAGGGAHGLMYAIHQAKHSPGKLKVSLVEKNSKPGYKIGESTLPLWSLWLKMFGYTGEYLYRIFGLKDGFTFYFLDRENQGQYTDFSSNGPPGFILNGFQIERPISELFLTMVAQRAGVNVYHGRQVDFNTTKVEGGLHNNRIQVQQGKFDQKPAATLNSSLLVDATGRFRQMASKSAPVKRFDGFNTDAFWAYFDSPADEVTGNPFKFYTGMNTTHLCMPEGWVWVIRLPTWEGSPVAGLMDMMNYLLDCSEAGTHGDQIPSSEELAKMFGLKFRWVTSIGFAVRNDVKYPEDMSQYGTKEAERKFWYFVEKYDLIKQFMKKFTIIENLYGPNSTWFIRKTLTYQSPKVSGPGWLAVGDACGFTNPLYSPGITAASATSTYASELTLKALEEAKTSSNAELTIRETLKPYDEFAQRLYPKLDLMNRFNYLGFRDQRLGPQVSVLWQFLVGVATPNWQLIKTCYNLNLKNWTSYITNWAWGSFVPEYEKVAKIVVEATKDIPIDETIPDEVVDALIIFSNHMKRKALATKKFEFRWEGLLRYYDADLNYTPNKVYKDQFARQCNNCGGWITLRSDWMKCAHCGHARSSEDAAVAWNPPLEFMEKAGLLSASLQQPTELKRENNQNLYDYSNFLVPASKKGLLDELPEMLAAVEVH